MLYFPLFKTYKIKLNLKPDRFYRLPKVTRELTRFKNLFNIKIEKYIFVALRKYNLESILGMHMNLNNLFILTCATLRNVH